MSFLVSFAYSFLLVCLGAFAQFFIDKRNNKKLYDSYSKVLKASDNLFDRDKERTQKIDELISAYTETFLLLERIEKKYDEVIVFNLKVMEMSKKRFSSRQLLYI